MSNTIVLSAVHQVRHPGRNIAQPNTQLTDGNSQMIRPRAAELGALLGEQTGHLVNTLEVSARRFSGEMAASASAS